MAFFTKGYDLVKQFAHKSTPVYFRTYDQMLSNGTFPKHHSLIKYYAAKSCRYSINFAFESLLFVW